MTAASALPITTRFAPSPTGRLHLGHAFSALLAHRVARMAGGRFSLRLEDIDRVRSKPEFESAIAEDLAWIGVDWDGDIVRQSDDLERHRALLGRLTEMGLTYPCFCTRADIAREIAESGHAPHGPDGPIYPGTCRGLSEDERKAKIAGGLGFAIRLDTEKATARIEDLGTLPLSFAELLFDAEAGPRRVVVEPTLFGDVVLARKDVPTSYHLSVVADDAVQAITHVVRGRDLFEATHVHRVLQELAGIEAPLYAHHQLILDDAGKRLAKRHDALSLKSLRENGATPADIVKRLPPVDPLAEHILSTSR